jgi:hypothetical protein
VSEERFWLVLQEPGCVPERKGPWRTRALASTLREFMAARPTAYIHVLRLDFFGDPCVEHGPEVLQMIDARSMGAGRKHNARVREAHAAYHGPTPNNDLSTDNERG